MRSREVWRRQVERVKKKNKRRKRERTVRETSFKVEGGPTRQRRRRESARVS